MTAAKGYWPTVFARMRPCDTLTVATRARAAAIARNAGRRGWCVWRERRGERYALRVVGRTDTRGKR
jgi:hypothetical protein